MYTYKVMLLMNNKQETRVRQTMNKCIECQNIIWDLLDGCLKYYIGLPKCGDVRKLFTDLKKVYDEKTIKEREGLSKSEIRSKHLDVLFRDVSNNALKQTVKDTYNAFLRYMLKQSGYPRRKTFGDSRKGFYIDPYKIHFTESKVKLEKLTTSTKTNRRLINWIKLAEKNRIPIGVSYYNPRVVIEKDRFYLTVSVDDEHRPLKHKRELILTEETIGLDININTINLSNSVTYQMTNEEVDKIEREIKALQRKLARQYEQAKKEGQSKNLNSRKNYQKTKKILSNKYSRLNNVKDTLRNKIVSEIISQRPKCIAIESLEVKRLLRAKRASKGMQKAAFRKFIDTLEGRVRYTKIEIIKVDRFFASSKICSCCGNKKEDLRLKDRVYKCDKCGLVIDRDYNAALNIRNYVLGL